MSTFDPSVIASIGRNTPDIGASMEKGIRLKDMLDQNQITTLKLNSAKGAMANAAKAKEILTNSDYSTPQGVNETANKLQKAGLVDEAMEFQRKIQEHQTGEYELQLKKLQVADEQQGIIVGTLDPILQQLEARKAAGDTPAMLDAKAQQLTTKAIQDLSDARPDLAAQLQQFAKNPQALTYSGLKTAEGMSKKGQELIKQRLAEHAQDTRDKAEATGERRAAVAEERAAATEQHLNFMEAQAAAKSARESEGLSPDVLDVAVPAVMQDPNNMKQFASWGKAGQAKRDQINEGIAHRLKESGMSPNELASMRARYKGEQKSINNLTVQKNAIETFEGLAKYNGQRLLDLIDKVDDTGIPVIEGYTRRAKRATGDPDAAEFASVMTSFQAEAARIIAQPNMVGVLSDSARHEVEKMAPQSVSAAQAKRIINRLFTEMDMRKTLIDQTIASAGQGMAVPGGEVAPGHPVPAGGASPTAAPAPAAAPAGGKNYDPATGTFK